MAKTLVLATTEEEPAKRVATLIGRAYGVECWVERIHDDAHYIFVKGRISRAKSDVFTAFAQGVVAAMNG